MALEEACAHAALGREGAHGSDAAALARAEACATASLAQLAELSSGMQLQVEAMRREVAALQHTASGRVPLCVARQVARVRPLNLRLLMDAPRVPAPRPAAAFFLLAPRDYKPEERHWERVAEFALAAANDTDVFVVMSGVARELDFMAYVAQLATATARALNPRLYTLDVDAWTGDSAAGLNADIHRTAIVATKCYFAIAVLHPCYEAALRLDAEVQLLRPDLLVPHVRGYLANGLIYANSGAEAASPNLLINAVQHYYNASEQERWRAATEDHTLFFFFNSMPVYDLRDVPAFLAHVRMVEEFFIPHHAGASHSLNNWEYDKYTAFKVLRGDWKFWETTRTMGLPSTLRLESMFDTDAYIRICSARPPGLLWAREAVCGVQGCACRAMPDAITPIMLFHLNYPAGPVKECSSGSFPGPGTPKDIGPGALL